MSAKWVRSQQWEREHLTGPLTPVRWVLHAFSSITLAVILLVLVSLYGLAASVPVGLVALAPTYLVYAVLLLAIVGIVAVLPSWGLWRLSGRGRPALRFALTTIVLVLLCAASWWLWITLAWPSLRYSETTGEGLRLFPEFVREYKAVTVRRTPWLEMSELEFYGWWPLKLLLLLFVVNMVTATLRRIEFSIPNLGVLTVHTGIVLLGLGSAVYAAAKLEGDVLLMSGPPDLVSKSGPPSPGPMEVGFFDNTRVVLRLRQTRTPQERAALNLPPDADTDQRLITGLPRYNDYNINAVPTLDRRATGIDKGRRLSIEVPAMRSPTSGLVDSDLRFRVVGYAAAAELAQGWSKAEPVGNRPAPDRPVRYVEMLGAVNTDGTPRADGSMRVMQTMGFMPTVPAERVVQIRDALGIEYTRNLSEERWAQLTAAIPMPGDPTKRPAGGLIVDIPSANAGAGLSRIYPTEPGSIIRIEGYTIEFVSLSPRPPFPVITPGFEGASSSVAVFRVTPPETINGGKPFDRYIYSRYPELTQDLSTTEVNTSGMPVRTAPMPEIKLTFVDATMVQVHMDERPDGTVRAFIRLPLPNGTTVIRSDSLKVGDSLPVGQALQLRLGQRLASVERSDVPVSITGQERERNLGTHKQAALAVEVSAPGTKGLEGWTRTVWLPFQLYSTERAGASMTRIDVPDGRTVEVAFGRLWHPLPGMALQLADFQMIPYPHSQQPQDFRSELLISKFDDAGRLALQLRRATSLNDPLLESAFYWSEDRNIVSNAIGWMSGSLLGTRFKFSQSGWDSGGWAQTKELVDKNELARPYGRFTILGVGNNPGIKVIALGSVLISIGIPWAFYVKPWMMRRRKEALARAAAEGRIGPAGVRGSAAVAMEMKR